MTRSAEHYLNIQCDIVSTTLTNHTWLQIATIESLVRRCLLNMYDAKVKTTTANNPQSTVDRNETGVRVSIYIFINAHVLIM